MSPPRIGLTGGIAMKSVLDRYISVFFAFGFTIFLYNRLL
jgi:hypothetical protein